MSFLAAATESSDPSVAEWMITCVFFYMRLCVEVLGNNEKNYVCR